MSLRSELPNIAFTATVSSLGRKDLSAAFGDSGGNTGVGSIVLTTADPHG